MQLLVAELAVATALLVYRIGHVPQQVLQPQHAAVTGFDGLAVLAVHGAEAHELQRALLLVHQARLVSAAEHPDKVQLLPLVHHINNAVRLEILLPLDNGGQVCGFVLGGAVRFQNQAGRHLPGVGVLLDVHHQRTVAEIGVTIGLHLFHHGGNVGLAVAFALPQVEFHVQLLIVLFQITDGHVDDVPPQRPVAGVAFLKLCGGLLSGGLVGLVRLGLLRGTGIDLLQIGDGEGGLLREAAGFAVVKVGELRLAQLQLGDDLANLQAPVSQVHITDDLVTLEAGDALDALTDDGGTQMAHMEGLCHVGSAVVDNDGLCFGVGFRAAAVVLLQLLHQAGQEGGGYVDVDEARTHHFHFGEHGVPGQHVSHLLGDQEGSHVIGLGTGHCAVALVLAQIRTVGGSAAAQRRVVACDLKGLRNLFRDLVN